MKSILKQIRDSHWSALDLYYYANKRFKRDVGDAILDMTFGEIYDVRRAIERTLGCDKFRMNQIKEAMFGDGDS